MNVSLVVPVRNEEESIEQLIASILQQTLAPDEVILVDGGSTDRTVEIVERFAIENPHFRLIKTSGASPGIGRNIGIDAARSEWIALTDAGIWLEPDWLSQLARVATAETDFIYGYVETVMDNSFDKCATLAYIPPPDQNGIRKSIASSLLRKSVWEDVGRFPDFRAAEDLIFMESIEKRGFKIGYAPEAIIHWHLRPDMTSTYKKFALYSKFNVIAGRQRYWQYGVLRQYLVLLAIGLFAAVFSWWILLLALGWISGRVLKKIVTNKSIFGWQPLFSPVLLLGTACVILVIDAATFVGWLQAYTSSKESK